MICPKCGNEMIYGKIGVSAGSRGYPTMFWAPEDVFNKHMPQFLTLKKVQAYGGLPIKLGNGFTSNRTTGYACNNCNCVVLDFSEN